MNQNPSFIEVYENALPKEICKNIIERFEKDPNKQKGRTGAGKHSGLNLQCKQNTEVFLYGRNDWKDIDNALAASAQKALVDYAAKYPSLKILRSARGEGYKIKRYMNNGEDKHNWHIDVESDKSVTRFLVTLWYLNDVEEGGETEFKYQGIKVKPKAGTLVIFPPFWTHWHKGHVPVSNSKYAINGFIHYKQVDQR